jgi:hypothetical protein
MRLLPKVLACWWTVSLLVPAAQQPIEFPHNKHIAFGLNCLDCHSSADTGAAATIPSVTKCMLCHAKLARDKAGVKQVIAYAERKREIPWQRVYGFSPSALVKFRHAPHYRAKIACATCHGDMTAATVAQPLVKHTMGSCLTCHRQQKASQDCTACHY